jgi:hypothetical protein
MHEPAADENENANQLMVLITPETITLPQQLPKRSEMCTMNISTAHQDLCHGKKKQFEASMLKQWSNYSFNLILLYCPTLNYTMSS